jgi:hypothetical protein
MAWQGSSSTAHLQPLLRVTCLRQGCYRLAKQLVLKNLIDDLQIVLQN